MSGVGVWQAFGGIMIGLIMIVSAIVLSLAGGMFLDEMGATFANAGFSGSFTSDAGTVWDSSTEIMVLNNLFYAMCIGMAILGLIIMYVSVTRRMRYDQSQNVYYRDDFYNK